MSDTGVKPILQGILYKRAQRSGTNWKRRYFKLFPDRLTYSVRANGKEKGKMEFTSEFFVQDGKAQKGKYGFLVTDFDTSYYLAAETKDEKDFWCHAIAIQIRKQLEKARYFEEVRKSTKVADQDLADKQYQARLENYYKTVGRPEAKQNRKSMVDFRAAQMHAEANEAAEKAEIAAEAAEKERLKKEAERLAQEAQKLREVAEKSAGRAGDAHESIVIGAETIPEEEIGEEDEDEEDHAPPIPDMEEEPEAAVSGHRPAPISVADNSAASSPSQSPHGSKLAAGPPPTPPRKNTIQPNGGGGSFSGLHEVPVSPSSSAAAAESNNQKQQQELQQLAAAASRSGSMISPPPAAAAAVETTPPDRRPTLNESRKPSIVAAASPISTSQTSTEALRKQSVVSPPVVISASSTQAADARKPSVVAVASTTTSDVRKPSVVVAQEPAAIRKPSVAVVSAPPPPSEPPKVAAAAPAAPEKEEQKPATAPKVSGGIASKLGMWQNKVEQHHNKQANNVFSGSYQGGGKPEIGKDQYGKAPEGSKTEERAKAASDWVEAEIEKLIKVILEMGEHDPQEGGIKTVKFGPLFYKYADISDTLVGILMRAKKRKRLFYQGDMLFQTMHDHVKITVLQA